MSAPALFGTDGVRGVAGVYPLDPPTVARLGAAIARTCRRADRTLAVAIGRDTRESGEWIERELSRGIEAEGGRVTAFGVLPTPAVAYLTRTGAFDLGVVLSASHNPFGDNGIKVFSGAGEKFAEVDERAVERDMADTSWRVPAAATAHLATADERAAYIEHLLALAPSPAAVAGWRVAVDMANGATVTVAPGVFERLGVEVVPLGDAPNGRNINLGCGSTHPAGLVAAVKARACQIGVAFDGDGDRAIFVDARGHVVDGDAVLYVLALERARQGRLAGRTVVATVMSNLGLELALGDRGIALVRTPVGDKYVQERMAAGGFVLGGEQSGHVILAEHLPTGDGLATALALLSVMADTGRPLHDLAAGMVTLPQTLVNVRVREKRPVDDVSEIRAAVSRVEAAQAGRGRVLVRYSGTEPLLRIMIEGEDQASVQAWAEEIAEAVRATLA
jgi:phosphoglucosamine mutase